MVRVGAAQIEIFDEIESNVVKVLEYIKKASAKKIDIVCFPESCLGEQVITKESPEVRQICNACKEHSIYCVVGGHFQEGNRVFNSSVLIDKSGKIIHQYHKNHLFPKLDLETTSSGNTNSIVETEHGKIGIIICWDFAYPEDIRKLAQQGAQIIFCPSYLLNDADITKPVFRSIPLTRAFENLAYFVMVDAYTDEVLCESQICDPLKILEQIRGKEGLIHANLDIHRIERLRKKFNHLSQ